MTQVNNLEEAQFLIYFYEKNNQELKQERTKLYEEIALLKNRLSEQHSPIHRPILMTVTKGGKAV
nr:MAG TPA: B-ZIP transcription factor [Caudoviricetes sp.]